MKQFLKLFVAVVVLSGGFLLAGCSSSPSDEELKQLTDMKAEVAKLEQQVADKGREKANLEKQVAEKNGKLQQCQSDQEAVKKGLGK